MKEMTIKPFKAGTKAGRKALTKRVESYFKHCSAYSAIERAVIASELANVFDKLAKEYRKQAFEQDILPDGDKRDYVRLNEDGRPYDSSKFGKEFKYVDKNGNKYYLQVLQNQPDTNAEIVKLANLLYTYNENQSANDDDNVNNVNNANNVNDENKAKLPSSGIDKVDECAMSLVALDDADIALFHIREYERQIEDCKARLKELANDLRYQVGLPEEMYEHKGTVKIVVK